MIWVGALVLFGYWLFFNALTAVLLSWTPAPGATIPSFSQEFLDRRKANVEGTPSEEGSPLDANQVSVSDVPRLSGSGMMNNSGMNNSGMMNKVHDETFSSPSVDSKSGHQRQSLDVKVGYKSRSRSSASRLTSK